MKRDGVAVVDEARCIGCARCIDACPVDAIVGAQGYLHAVVEDWCIGCRLCLPPCPVDCIDFAPARRPWTQALKNAAGSRAKARATRLSGLYGTTLDPRAAVAAVLARKRR